MVNIKLDRQDAERLIDLVIEQYKSNPEAWDELLRSMVIDCGMLKSDDYADYVVWKSKVIKN